MARRSPFFRIISITAVFAAFAACPSLATATTGAPAPPATSECQTAEALGQAGEDSEARKLYVAQLEKNPSSGCAEQGLAKLNAPTSTSFKGHIEDILNWLPDVAGMLGVVAVLLILLLAIVGWLFGAYKIQTPRFWTRIFRTRLTLENLDDQALEGMKIGTTMTARIRERLQSFREEATSDDGVEYGLDFDSGNQEVADIVSGDDQLSAALDKLGAASSQLGLIATIVNLLIKVLPIKRLKLTGVVEPNVGTAAATTLALQSGARLAAAGTLSGPELKEAPKAGDYLRLCDSAAVWVQYAVASQISDRVKAEDAESYALVREGLVLYQSGSAEEGMRRYERALELDPRNWAARVNLAIAMTRGLRAYTEAATILSDALEELKMAEQQ